MADVKAWREGAAGEPSFPAKFEGLRKAVLQATDISNNHNKYYCVELHQGGNQYRVYTHYGRTDDLESNPNAGARESRYFSNLGEAESCYSKIYKEKTSAKKGYREVNLASAKIGHRNYHGQSVGHVDKATLDRIKPVEGSEKKEEAAPKKAVVTIASEIQELVAYIYSEANNALKTITAASFGGGQVTAKGIETPLGVLTIGQIDQGQAILDLLAKAYQKAKRDQLTALSNDFYRAIPHRVGRTRDAIQEAILDTAEKLNEKQDALQLMRDMLNVNGNSKSKKNVVENPEIQEKYEALNCQIDLVTASTFKEVANYVEKSKVRGYGNYKVKNIWKISRKGEHEVFAEAVGNNRLLFHGSAPKNWLGILSRGLLLPKIVVSLGVKRTDAGWLGNGIYFGDAVCTSCGYAGIGKRNSRFLTVANVALGNIKQYRKITYGLDSPPSGFDSCHGVRGSEFSDNEYVIYKQNQQRLDYLVEVAA